MGVNWRWAFYDIDIRTECKTDVVVLQPIQMGNANSNDRRKSHDAGTSFTAHELFKSNRANQTKSFEEPLNGPVAITAGRHEEFQGHQIDAKVSSRLNGHRPRATTEGGRQRYRQASMGDGNKYGEHKGLTNEQIQEEIRLGNVGTGKKRLPTIIKYTNNNAKEVYLCGKTAYLCFDFAVDWDSFRHV